MSFKNLLIRSGLKILPIAQNPIQTPRRFLIVSTTALGDTLWATPPIESLRASFPDAYIAVLTRPIGVEILKHNPWTNAVHLLENPWTAWKALAREKFDTALIFHASQRLPLPLCKAIGASKIVGSAGINKGLDSLLTDPLPIVFEHEIVRRLRMVEAVGGKISSETLSFFLQPEERASIQLEEGPWIAIHPGSKDRFKRWPLSHFAEVGKQLQKKLSCKILITGSEGERNLMENLAAQIPGSKLVSEKLQIRAFAAVLERMSLLISNDTGPFHLACALKRPAIGIYASTLPQLCGPHLAKTGIAISNPPTCNPCLKRECRLPFCFLQIGPSQVIEAALKLGISPC